MPLRFLVTVCAESTPFSKALVRLREVGLSHLTSARLVGQESANVWKARQVQTTFTCVKNPLFVKKQNFKIE